MKQINLNLFLIQVIKMERINRVKFISLMCIAVKRYNDRQITVKQLMVIIIQLRKRILNKTLVN